MNYWEYTKLTISKKIWQKKKKELTKVAELVENLIQVTNVKLSSSFSPHLSFDQPNFVKLKIEETSSVGKSKIKEIKEEFSKLLDLVKILYPPKTRQFRQYD